MVTTRSAGSSRPQTPPPVTSNPKRRRPDDEFQDENADPKRARTEKPTRTISTQPHDKFDPFLLFSKNEASDDEEELSRSAPPKSFAEMIRRDRRMRPLRQQKSNTLGRSPRRPLARVTGQNPFGIETFTQQELDRTQSASVVTSTPQQGHEIVERSAAPEPETPKPSGIFGSLRKIGQSLFGSLTPRVNSSTPSPEDKSTLVTRNTEPRGVRKSKPVWEIEYPQLPTTPEPNEEELSESEKKRRAYEAKYGKVNSDYDHLHTESIDGDPSLLPYPIKKNPPPAIPVNEDDMTPAEATFRQERRKANMERFGPVPEKVLPKIAPLFGPDSHATRRTVNPRDKEFKETGIHPADREDAERSRKRKAVASTLR